MMNINERLKRVLIRESETIHARPDVQSALEDLEELEQTGVLQTSEYSLPSAETTNRQMLREARRAAAYNGFGK